ncbi:S8 family peptidase [Streptomyces albireticuli]|nr:S8 family peptidase [Streptomyces albireticuli]MCD9144226.1 S8 family serine peptidase [Streptomyces albireticuli]MCD9162131.1 S8 family serine peptidase [Streptomyces albireticuli]MCD9193863.1 S8 family serine peptidase [Streptomyces albireticuli]
MPQSSGAESSGGSPPPPESLFGRPELVCVTRPGAGVRITASGATADADVAVGALDAVAAESDVVITPLFGVDRRAARAPSDGAGGADGTGGADGAVATGGPAADDAARRTLDTMALFYHVDAPADRLEELAERLRSSDAVEAAYVKPGVDLAVQRAERKTVPRQAAKTAKKAVKKAVRKAGGTVGRQGGPGGADPAAVLNDMAPDVADAPPVTPDFTARQGYLDAAPGGVDARYAWTLPGGRGAGVRVIDCEWGWRFTHEDLLRNQGGIVSGTGSTDTGFVNHGTAVLGEIGGDVNAFGVTGISPDAVTSASAFSIPTATAIRNAADRLGPGDIILLEIHRPGPRATGAGQQGFIAVEWWPDDYLAIRYAVDRGITVVEAAGNGAEDLDHPAYDTPQPGFPAWWRNPFRRTALDAGAVIVGAGAPPPGTHGADHGPDRSRLDFSNFGACVDAQGWGREVTTTGYGDLQGGTSQDLWYTDRFSGTSSASPIVVGALAATQGVLRANGRIPLSPARSRQLLRATGSPQQDAPGRPATQRIGNRPNLRQLIPAALQTATWVGVQFRATLPGGRTGRWFTHSWPAHWHVVWTVVPTSPRPGAPQVRWKVRVERASDGFATYWIDVTNLVTDPVDFEARFAVLGW